MTIRQALVNAACRLLPVLSRAGRGLSIVLLMMAVSITGTGWSAAMVLPAANEVIKASAADHHGADEHDTDGEPANDLATCQGAAGCGSHHQPQDLAQTCCAMACHTAILAVDCVAPVSFVIWQIKHQQLADVLEGSAAVRLERPPRLIRA